MDDSTSQRFPDKAENNITSNLLNLALTKIDSLEKQFTNEKLRRIELMEYMTQMAQTIQSITLIIEKNQAAKTLEEEGKLQDIQKVIREVGINLSQN